MKTIIQLSIAFFLATVFMGCSKDDPTIKLSRIKVTAFPANDRVGGNLFTWDDFDVTAPNDTLPDIFVIIQDGAGAEVWRTVDYTINAAFDASPGDNVEFSLGVALTLDPDQTYNIQILDYDAFSGNDLMGSAQMKPSDKSIGSSETPITLSNGSFSTILYMTKEEE